MTSANGTVGRKTAGQRIPALDGIRGIAVIVVMLFHFTSYRGMQPNVLIDKVYYKAATAGWGFVDLFFVLSGFLITGILLEAKGQRSYFRVFYLRRFLRIFPLYYAFLIFSSKRSIRPPARSRRSRRCRVRRPAWAGIRMETCSSCRWTIAGCCAFAPVAHSKK